jgi:hypothetical protein
LVFMSTNTKGQDKLVRVQKNSNYYTDNKTIFFVVSNKFNSSGILFPDESLAPEIIIVKKEESNQMFDNKCFVLDLDDFLKNYSRKTQFPEYMTIAIKIPDISMDGFVIIERNYASYKYKVLYEYQEIKEIDLNSLKVIKNEWDQDYIKDINAVFYRSRKIINSDPTSFEVLDLFYAKDNTHVYNSGEILENADPASFLNIDNTYQLDNYQVWVYGKPINADIKTFKIIKYNYPGDTSEHISLYSADKSHVYFQRVAISEADPRTFKILCSDSPNQYYGIDKNYIYYNDKIIEGADVNTFNVVKKKTDEIQYDAFDKTFHYYRDEKETITNK